MHEKQELRAFHTRAEMLEDYRDFCIHHADQFHERDGTARKGIWRIRWGHGSRAGGILQSIAGMEFNRIQCDIRVDWEEQRMIMTRLRSPHHPVEPMIAFIRKPWEVKYD